jgi:ABC-type antimicrobial peptide transport system permease subunit
MSGGELRRALRSLLGTRGFSAVVVVTTALGIGTATAVYGQLLRVADRRSSDYADGAAPYDPVVYATVTLVLIAVSALAVAVPARRASHVDPIVALRSA